MVSSLMGEFQSFFPSLALVSMKLARVVRVRWLEPVCLFAGRTTLYSAASSLRMQSAVLPSS